MVSIMSAVVLASTVIVEYHRVYHRPEFNFIPYIQFHSIHLVVLKVQNLRTLKSWGKLLRFLWLFSAIRLS